MVISESVYSVNNWWNGGEHPAESQAVLEKYNPHDGTLQALVARSTAADIAFAVKCAAAVQPAWAENSPGERGACLRKFCEQLDRESEAIAQIVAAETGKSLKDARGEVQGAIALGHFYAGEGQRLNGRTVASGVRNRFASVVREPIGVAGLIISANTPIANIAWKVFPALICGNAAVVKSSEDTPRTSLVFAQAASRAGVPAGLLNVVQGLGAEAGLALAQHPDVGVVSFTGSSLVGREIGRIVSERLGRLSLELGGKNPLVVCDDADLDRALNWTLLSAYSNAGQRCAAASRIIVFEAIYKQFRERLVSAIEALKVGPGDGDFLGPVISERALKRIMGVVERAAKEGAKVVCGGRRLTDSHHAGGYYVAPTLIEEAAPDSEISQEEVFGPVACLYRVADFEAALSLANRTRYGLTSCIHTANLNRAYEFTRRIRSGVVSVNGGTFGSEPHMPFGGSGISGNGSREPGLEGLDVYSEKKNVVFNIDSKMV